MTLTLGSRLTAVYTAVFGALIVTMAAVSYNVLAYQLDADVTANLSELTSGLHGYLQFETGTPTVEFDPSDAAEAAFVSEAVRYYQVFDATSGQLLAQSDGLRPFGLDFTPAEVRELRNRHVPFDVQTDYGRIRLSNSVLTPSPSQVYLLQVGVSLEAMDRTLRRFLVLLLVSVPTGLLAAFVVGRWMARVALRPLTQLAGASRAIGIENLPQRLPVRGAGDELDAVAMAFNDTLARLEASIGEMRQFSAALAHELRTPLAALRGDIELGMMDPGTGEEAGRRLASQLEEIDKLKHLIDQVLVLARAEAGEIPLKAEPLDLCTLTAALVDLLEPIGDAKGIAVECGRMDTAVVSGDSEWLKRLVLNLLDNAIKFTPAGGRVFVDVAREASSACLSVRDTGIGISAAAQPHVFERFFRADPARSPDIEGVGLGLSLARWIVERHHGLIEVESRPGHGSTFTVHLPLAHTQGRALA
jgi:two-component system OmpR family sensor kinase